jgi:hypothetical protein
MITLMSTLKTNRRSWKRPTIRGHICNKKIEMSVIPMMNKQSNNYSVRMHQIKNFCTNSNLLMSNHKMLKSLAWSKFQSLNLFKTDPRLRRPLIKLWRMKRRRSRSFWANLLWRSSRKRTLPLIEILLLAGSIQKCTRHPIKNCYLKWTT